MHEKPLPLSLYSVGSSLLPFMLKDEEALEFAKEALCESLSDPLIESGRKFSSCTVETPFGIGGLRPKGFRKGGMLARLTREYRIIYCLANQCKTSDHID